jgi:dipeptidyl aminopeptidase/acylaminoacyl peptidase
MQVRPRRLHGNIATAIAILALAVPATAQQPRVTLEQLMSAPFATELIASHAGGQVAWVQNVLGSRSIWIAGPPAYSGRQVLRYPGDDGNRVAQLEFTPDAAAIVYVRGGAQSGRRQPHMPNAALDPDGGREEVWLVSVAGGEPTRIDEGYGPSVSPRGDLVIYTKADRIWAAPLMQGSSGTTAGEPRELFRDLGTVTDPRWSPDGRQLAFVSSRGSHSFIGVYDVDGHSLVFLDPSFERDQSPIWSPDGSRIAYIRSSGSRPWSFRVTDVKTQSDSEVWRAPESSGGAPGRRTFWADGDRLVFAWEKTGWWQLYSVPLSGGEPIALTAGEFEVEQVTLAPDRRTIYFSSNEGDIDRRHLWRVSVAEGPPELLTPGTGTEYGPVVTSDGAALGFLAVGGKVSPRAEIMPLTTAAGGGVRQLLAPDIAPEQFHADVLVEPQQVIFPATDGLQIHGQLFLPPDYQPNRRYPAVLYFHGGPQAQMVLGYHYHTIDYYQKMYALNQYLAHDGYIVLSVNYRGGTGYGMQFRQADATGGRGASEVRDVIGAGEYLRGRTDVDSTRIGLWGGSYGGYLTAMGLAVASNMFAAGVDVHGVHSWDARLSDNERDDVRQLARQSSPIGNVGTWRSPVLLIHGDDDRNVAFTQSVTLYAELRRHGVDVEYLVFPNDEHPFLLHTNWLRAWEAAADFFDRKLKNRTTSAQSDRFQGRDW